MRRKFRFMGAAVVVASTLGLTGAIAQAAQATPSSGEPKYQVEISWHDSIPTQVSAGISLSLELDKDHGGVFNGSDHLHATPHNGLGFPSGGNSTSPNGTLTWTQVDDNLVIYLTQAGEDSESGVTVTVPAKYGHYDLPVHSVLSMSELPPSDTMVQVSP